MRSIIYKEFRYSLDSIGVYKQLQASDSLPAAILFYCPGSMGCLEFSTIEKRDQALMLFDKYFVSHDEYSLDEFQKDMQKLLDEDA